MNFEQRLNLAADAYKAQGYEVILRPEAEDLPDFARDFHLEIVARRGKGGVLASAKNSQLELEADREVSRYAEIVAQHPGWRYDIVVLTAISQSTPPRREASEPTEEDIRGALIEVERMFQAGFAQQSLIAAWAVLESAMRRRLHADGKVAGWGSSARTMLNELYSEGVLPSAAFRELEELFQVRSAIVHGFKGPEIENRAIELLIQTTRALLDESHATKKTA